MHCVDNLKLNLILAPKIFGDWANDGACNGEGENPTCGPGTQVQTRSCTDGTVDKCTEEDKQSTVTCTVAGTQLPTCSKFIIPHIVQNLIYIMF